MVASDRVVRLRRLAVWGAAVAALAYMAWIMGPYLRSAVVRDATVTSWIYVATSPIQGKIEGKLPHQGYRVEQSANGEVLFVVNRFYDMSRVVAARGDVEAARLRAEGLEKQLAEERDLNVARREMKSGYATRFRELLDEQIARGETTVQHYEEQVKLLAGLVQRRAEMAKAGIRSQELVDEARLRLSAVQTSLMKSMAELSQARLYREAADDGVFMVPGGADPSWVLSERAQTRRAIAEVRQRLAAARAEQARAEILLKGEEDKYRNQSQA